MKRFLFFGALILPFFIFKGAATAVVEPKPAAIVIGFNPGGHPAQIRPLALELAGDIQKELGIPVEIVISKNYEGLVHEMKDQKIDFAFFTSKTFVEAEREAGAKVLLKKVWSQPFYFSALLARGPVKKIADLKGKRIAFVDKDSASGYLYPMLHLRKSGLTDEQLKITWAGNHASAVAKLEDHEVDAAAVFADEAQGGRNAWEKFARHPKNKDVRVLWVSGPIPTDPFCVRQDFYNKYPMTVHSLMLSLIDLFEKKRDRFADLLGTKELVPATSRQYDSIRDMMKEFGGVRP